MSRVAKQVINIPAGVTFTVGADAITVKGAKGSLSLPVGEGVSVAQENKQLQVSYADAGAARTRAGATRAHLANMVVGVTRGYDRKLELVVETAAEVRKNSLNLLMRADALLGDMIDAEAAQIGFRNVEILRNDLAGGVGEPTGDEERILLGEHSFF